MVRSILLHPGPAALKVKYLRAGELTKVKNYSTVNVSMDQSINKVK